MRALAMKSRRRLKRNVPALVMRLTMKCAAKAKLDIDPASGQEIEQVVTRLFNLEPALVAKLNELLLR